MRKFIILALLALSVPTAIFANESVHFKKIDWPFDGMLGTVDRQAAQRGYQVYKEVCATCHAMKLVYFRNLEQIGFSADEVKALASQATVKDGPDSEGNMFDRPGRPSDRFPSPFANDNAAKASNGGALPPDLSLIIKARHDGANYVYSLLTGYEPAPADVQIGEGLYYNPYFISGNQLAMPPPLSEGGVSYMDGTQATVDQMAYDVVNFLQFAAEPEMEHRKAMGWKALLFLTVIAVLFYFANKRTWEDVK